MQKLFLPFLIILSLNSYSQKQLDEKWVAIPEILKKDANAIIRDYNIEYDLNTIGSLTEKVSKIITILDNEGKQNATQVWHYDVFSKYTSGELLFYDKTGALIEKKHLNDMEDYGTSGMANFFDDSRLKVYKPLIKETPYTLVMTYTKKYSSFFQMPTWFPQNSSKTAVESASLSIYNPNKVAYKTKENAFAKDQYRFIEEGDYKKWLMENVSAFKPETYTKYSQLASISFPLNKFKMQGFEGNTDTWAGFGKWSADLIAGRDELPEETVAKILDMTAGIDDPKEKAKIIYAWMQENTRYISIQYGIGGWQPFEASEVDNLKYGDCKGLANYAKALFKAAGIESYYAIIYAGAGNKSLDVDFPSNQFNHAILCVPFDGDTTWVECTADNIALGYLGDFTDDRNALLINGSQSKLVKTTAYPIEENTQLRSGKVIVNADGSAKSTLHTSFAGLQSKYRMAQIKEDEKDRKDYLYRTMDLAGFTINEISYDYKMEIHPEIIEDISIDIPKYANSAGSRMFLPLNLLNKNRVKPDKDTLRMNKIYVSLDYMDCDSLVFQIPEGYSIEQLPKARSYESIYGKYSSTVSSEGNLITYVRKQEQNAGNFPAEGWDDFRKYKLNIVKADKATAILRKN